MLPRPSNCRALQFKSPLPFAVRFSLCSLHPLGQFSRKAILRSRSAEQPFRREIAAPSETRRGVHRCLVPYQDLRANAPRAWRPSLLLSNRTIRTASCATTSTGINGLYYDNPGLIVRRGLQVALTEPRGQVYFTAPRANSRRFRGATNHFRAHSNSAFPRQPLPRRTRWTRLQKSCSQPRTVHRRVQVGPQSGHRAGAGRIVRSAALPDVNSAFKS